MARQFFFAITLMGIATLLGSPAAAVPDAARCEDQAANCLGRCANPNSGTGHNRCLSYCDRQVNRCLIRAFSADQRW
jgi:hypothetical protein